VIAVQSVAHLENEDHAEHVIMVGLTKAACRTSQVSRRAPRPCDGDDPEPRHEADHGAERAVGLVELACWPRTRRTARTRRAIG
jgi:hypothetical protein